MVFEKPPISTLLNGVSPRMFRLLPAKMPLLSPPTDTVQVPPQGAPFDICADDVWLKRAMVSEVTRMKNILIVFFQLDGIEWYYGGANCMVSGLERDLFSM